MKQYLSQNDVMRRYGVCRMTLLRWRKNPRLGFPAAVVINNRKYFEASELDAFDERQRMEAAAA